MKIEEKIQKDIQDVIDSWIGENTTNVTHGAAFNSLPPVRSEDKAHLVDLYNELKSTLNTDAFDIEFHQEAITIKPRNTKGHTGDKFNPVLASLLEHMIESGMKITPLPEIKVRRDVNEASNMLGKTAHYSPDIKEIVLYVEGRHPKDVLRSFCHEMVHHMQNLEGRLVDIQTSDVNEDSRLEKLEEEAYLKGNITFRKWEDKEKLKTK